MRFADVNLQLDGIPNRAALIILDISPHFGITHIIAAFQLQKEMPTERVALWD